MRSPEVGREALAELDTLSRGAALHSYSQCDVTSEEKIRGCVSSCCYKHGRVDILINNAGINIPALLVDPDGKEQLSAETMDRIYAVNVRGPMLVAQAVAKQMLLQEPPSRGVIINVSSEARRAAPLSPAPRSAAVTRTADARGRRASRAAWARARTRPARRRCTRSRAAGRRR